MAARMKTSEQEILKRKVSAALAKCEQEGAAAVTAAQLKAFEAEASERTPFPSSPSPRLTEQVGRALKKLITLLVGM